MITGLMTQFMTDIADLIERGGVVMIPLLALSVIALALIIERSLFWWFTNRPRRARRVERAMQLLAAGDSRAGAVSSDPTVYGHVARSLLKSGASDASAIAAVEAVRPRMERYMVTLSTIITAAPLLGILGTVLGIIESFDLLGQQETLADPRGVSAGIAEALLTTAVGLVVALLTLFPYMIFKGQLDRSLGRLEALVAAIQQGRNRVDETNAGEEGTRKEPGDRRAVTPPARVAAGSAKST